MFPVFSPNAEGISLDKCSQCGALYDTTPVDVMTCKTHAGLFYFCSVDCVRKHVMEAHQGDKLSERIVQLLGSPLNSNAK